MGTLKFVCGTMGAGKTALALDIIEGLEEKGKFVQVFKTAADRRGEENKIVSRDGRSHLAWEVNAYFEFMAMLPRLISRGDVIVVDEAQFLVAYQVEDLRRLVDAYGVTVVCFGLRTDYRSQLFPASQRLMELADSVEVISAKCACGCGRDAMISAKIDSDGHIATDPKGLFEPGDIGRYQPLCNACFEKAKASSFTEVLEIASALGAAV